MAAVLQILTYITILIKKNIGYKFKHKTSKSGKVGHIFSVWLVLFLSKFVFLEVIDIVFGQAVYIGGFIGLMAIIVVMTATKELTDHIFNKLAD